MNNLISSLKGIWRLMRSTKIFDPAESFKNRRVAIIGPADSAYFKQNGDYIDSFDFVIRINKAPHSWTPEKKTFIGSKMNIWYHSFFENEDSGGGSLDSTILKKFEIDYLVNPRTDFGAYRRTFNYYRKYQSQVSVYHLPNSIYKKMIKPFGDLKPTVGFTALYSALHSECSELFITGFTFFKTPYAKGYRDHLRDMDANKKHFKKQGIHDAHLEYELFKNLMQESNCQNIIVDDKLREILEADR